MAEDQIIERFLAAFSSAETESMRALLAPDLVAWVTTADGTIDRVEGAMVEVHAERNGRTLHNFAAHLLRLPDDQIAEWWMADAKPAMSDAFWATP